MGKLKLTKEQEARAWRLVRQIKGIRPQTQEEWDILDAEASKPPTRGHDLRDSVFGKLIVVDCEGSDKHGDKIWYCLCECGETKSVGTRQLQAGKTNACNRCQRAQRRIDLTGEKIGRLLVIAEVEMVNKRGKKKMGWFCECDCGNTKTIEHGYLKTRKTQSCGCLQREKAIKNLKETNKKRFG